MSAIELETVNRNHCLSNYIIGMLCTQFDNWWGCWYGGTLEIALRCAVLFISVTITIANVLDMSNAQIYTTAWFEPMAGSDDNGATIYLSYRVHRNCTATLRWVIQLR